MNCQTNHASFLLSKFVSTKKIKGIKPNDRNNPKNKKLLTVVCKKFHNQSIDCFLPSSIPFKMYQIIIPNIIKAKTDVTGFG